MSKDNRTILSAIDSVLLANALRIAATEYGKSAQAVSSQSLRETFEDYQSRVIRMATMADDADAITFTVEDSL